VMLDEAQRVRNWYTVAAQMLKRNRDPVRRRSSKSTERHSARAAATPFQRGT
jgi:hypothetical protein